ncbi:unnamed protein product [Prunus armeniaca]
MSDLIRRRRAVKTTPSSKPPAQPTSAATALALMEHDHVLVGPGGSQAPSSLASSVVKPVSTRLRHWPTSTTDNTSTDAKRNTRGLCRQLKRAKVTRVTNSRISIRYDERHRAAPMAELHSSLAHDIGHVVRTRSSYGRSCLTRSSYRFATNYNLEDLDEESLAYVNRLFGERYKQWKSDLHRHFEAFDDLQVALQEGCPKELEGQEDSWAWLCTHFQAPDYVGGSKFPEIDVFGDVYVRPRNELAESLHTTMVERSQLVLQESTSQLPPETPIESVDPPQDAGF